MNLLNGIENWGLQKAEEKFQSVRKTAQKRVAETTWPDRHQENWKYTNLDFLKNIEWKADTGSVDNQLQSQYAKQKVGAFESLSFINGVFQELPVMTLPARQLKDLSSAELASVFGEDSKQDLFQSLNSAWGKEGLLIEIPDGKSYDRPICIDFYFSTKTTAVAAHPRLLINVGRGAVAKIIFRVIGEGTYFNNLVARINLAPESQVEFVNFQSNSETSHSFSDLQFSLAKTSQLQTYNVCLGGKLNREKLEIFHEGEESISSCNGVYLTKGKNQSDHYTNIEHRVGHCQSHQLYKGLLSDESRAVFNGRVFINHGAAKADSSQLNNNLLLSSKAEIDSKPQLEILADDVKATHGSTVGQLDEDEIFYLQSRGIPRSQAIQLLAHGFAYEILSQIQDAKLGSWLKYELQQKLVEMDFT